MPDVILSDPGLSQAVVWGPPLGNPGPRPNNRTFFLFCLPCLCCAPRPTRNNACMMVRASSLRLPEAFQARHARLGLGLARNHNRACWFWDDQLRIQHFDFSMLCTCAPMRLRTRPICSRLCRYVHGLRREWTNCWKRRRHVEQMSMDLLDRS